MSKNVNFYKDYSAEILRSRAVNGLRLVLLALLVFVFITGYLRQEREAKSATLEQSVLAEKIKIERDLIEALSKPSKTEIKSGSDVNEEKLVKSLVLLKKNVRGEFWRYLQKIITLPLGVKSRLLAVEFSDGSLLIQGEAINAPTADQVARAISIGAKESGQWQITAQQIVENPTGIFEFKLFFTILFPNSEVIRGKHE